MTYELKVFDIEGRGLPQPTVSKFGNIESARQAMLDYADVTDLPDEEPFFAPELRIVEGWFIDRTEFHIIQCR